jgi:hypothetical protein
MPGKYARFLEAKKYEGFVKTIYEELLDKSIGQVHLDKHYVGKRTGHSHQIDVSIETKVAGLEILILIECKHYKKTVEISDVLAFAQRLDDIGAHKGVVVSTIGFQEGTKKVARAHGIALVITEPVWRYIMPHRDHKGRIDAFTTGHIYIGGDSDKDLLLGVTAVATNFPVNIDPDHGVAWVGIVQCLSAECDENLRTAYLRSILEEQYTMVCPFCGEQLRTPTAKQCRHCRRDWHDLDNIICRSH